MKAIFEINGFQKIIEIDDTRPYIEMYFNEPFTFNLFKPLDLNDTDSKIIFFKYMGMIGEFLLYKYIG